MRERSANTHLFVIWKVCLSATTVVAAEASSMKMIAGRCVCMLELLHQPLLVVLGTSGLRHTHVRPRLELDERKERSEKEMKA